MASRIDGAEAGGLAARMIKEVDAVLSIMLMATLLSASLGLESGYASLMQSASDLTSKAYLDASLVVEMPLIQDVRQAITTGNGVEGGNCTFVGTGSPMQESTVWWSFRAGPTTIEVSVGCAAP